MNKIKIISVIVAVFVITATIFWACSKDNKETTPQVFNDTPEWDIDIDKLMAETGIDIYALSELPILQEVSEISIKQVESSINAKFNGKGKLTDEMLAELIDLQKKIEIASNKADSSAFLPLLEKFCTLLNSIDGISILNDKNGFQTVKYDDKVYSLPLNEMNRHTELSIATIAAITIAAPVFPNLSINTQEQVLTACISLNVSRSFVSMKAAPSHTTYEQCMQQAKLKFTGTMAAAEATYISRAIKCGGNLWCQGGMLALFGVATGFAVNDLWKDEDYCALKYNKKQ